MVIHICEWILHSIVINFSRLFLTVWINADMKWLKYSELNLDFKCQYIITTIFKSANRLLDIEWNIKLNLKLFLTARIFSIFHFNFQVNFKKLFFGKLLEEFIIFVFWFFLNTVIRVWMCESVKMNCYFGIITAK